MGSPNFLGVHAEREAAAAVVLPVPYEATVTYGQGTAGGPDAILAASAQVELYDREHDREPALDYGVHTLPALKPPPGPEAAVASVAEAVAAERAAGGLVVVLGGEHTISAGVTRGLLDAGDAPLTVVQLDAHCDLRDEYEGERFSHACTARRILDDPRVDQVLQLGVRSLDVEEARFVRANPERVRTWFAEDVRAGTWAEELAERVAGRTVHLTIDVDALDPSVVPATGTPEPDGLSWGEALQVVATTAAAARVVAIDCVELAPHPGQHAAEFAVAKLLYKSITYAIEGSDRA